LDIRGHNTYSVVGECIIFPCRQFIQMAHIYTHNAFMLSPVSLNLNHDPTDPVYDDSKRALIIFPLQLLPTSMHFALATYSRGSGYTMDGEGSS